MAKVIYEKRGKIAYVTLNRPEVHNCVDPETHALMWETWEGLAAVRVLGADVGAGRRHHVEHERARADHAVGAEDAQLLERRILRGELERRQQPDRLPVAELEADKAAAVLASAAAAPEDLAQYRGWA